MNFGQKLQKIRADAAAAKQLAEDLAAKKNQEKIEKAHQHLNQILKDAGAEAVAKIQARQEPIGIVIKKYDTQKLVLSAAQGGENAGRPRPQEIQVLARISSSVYAAGLPIKLFQSRCIFHLTMHRDLL